MNKETIKNIIIAVTVPTLFGVWLLLNKKIKDDQVVIDRLSEELDDIESSKFEG